MAGLATLAQVERQNRALDSPALDNLFIDERQHKHGLTGYD